MSEEKKPEAAEKPKVKKTVEALISDLHDIIVDSIKNREGVDEQYQFEINNLKGAVEGFAKQIETFTTALKGFDKTLADLKKTPPTSTPPSAPPSPPPSSSPGGGGGGGGYSRGQSYGRSGDGRSYSGGGGRYGRDGQERTQDGWMASRYPTQPGEQVKRRDYASQQEIDMAEDGAQQQGSQGTIYGYYILTRRDGTPNNYIARAPVSGGQRG